VFRLHSRFHFVAAILLLVTVIDLGHLINGTQNSFGFARIARDLGRRFCDTEGSRAQVSCGGDSNGNSGLREVALIRRDRVEGASISLPGNAICSN